jgi:hypothetical protein
MIPSPLFLSRVASHDCDHMFNILHCASYLLYSTIVVSVWVYCLLRTSHELWFIQRIRCPASLSVSCAPVSTWTNIQMLTLCVQEKDTCSCALVRAETTQTKNDFALTFKTNNNTIDTDARRVRSQGDGVIQPRATARLCAHLFFR